MFHKHKWVELERFYAPPTRVVGLVPERELSEWLCFGVTTILFQSEDGSKFKRVPIIGQSLKEKKP